MQKCLKLKKLLREIIKNVNELELSILCTVCLFMWVYIPTRYHDAHLYRPLVICFDSLSLESTAMVMSRRSVHLNHTFVLFDLILYVPSTIFQLNRDGSSWVEPVLS